MAGAPAPGLSHKMSSKILRQKAQEFLSSRKYANNLIDIISNWEDTNISFILTLETIFTEILKRGDMYIERTITLTITEPSAETKYINWLCNCYEETWAKILTLLEHDKTAVQLQALTTAIKLMAEEGKAPLEPSDNLGYYFPLQRLKAILMKLLSGNRDNVALIERFQEISNYSDALYYTWKCFPPLTPKRQPQDVYIKNLLELIHKLPLLKDDEEAERQDRKLLCSENGSEAFKYEYARVRRALNKIWACVMHWELTPELHKQLLLTLLERVMMHLDKPVLMTDFLMDSLDSDGPIGVLALQGVFVLVSKYNLEYPNIFQKLYSMFEPEIFHTKYKARLFYLADQFLSSTHLPEGMVSAFAKRLSRLTLVAPPQDIHVILMFVGNLLIRHPGLKRMINHPNGPGYFTGIGSGSHDPFVMEERNPLNSNAMMSSLWEIQALQSHSMPSVATAARFIHKELPSIEYDMTSAVDSTTGELFDREIKNKVKNIMLTFERPTGLALPRGEKLRHYWQLSS